MRVTLHTDYSLRVLMYVATKGDQLSTIAEITDSFGISKNHVMKVVYQLGKGGYLDTVRGKNGGLKMLRDPESINIGALVRELEEGDVVLRCLSEPDYCCIEKLCVLRRAFREATKAFFAALDEYTLKDLIKPRAGLARLLQIEAVT